MRSLERRGGIVAVLAVAAAAILCADLSAGAAIDAARPVKASIRPTSPVPPVTARLAAAPPVPERAAPAEPSPPPPSVVQPTAPAPRWTAAHLATATTPDTVRSEPERVRPDIGPTIPNSRLGLPSPPPDAVRAMDRPPWVPPAPPGWTLSARAVTVGATRRWFLLARPVHPAPAMPLVVALHGRDTTPAQMVAYSGLLEPPRPAVVVYPEGYGLSWNAGYCCGSAHILGVNDVSFLEHVITAAVAASPGTSPKQVFLVGFSNGGRMAYRMACADPGAFSAVAAVEAVPVYTCPRATPVPLLLVASTADPLLTIPEDGRPKHIAGHAEPTVDEVMENWTAVDGCRSVPVTSVEGALTVRTWADCDHSARVEMAVYRGGRHWWPPASPRTPPAQALVWSFFDSAGLPLASGRTGAPPASGRTGLSAVPSAHHTSLG